MRILSYKAWHVSFLCPGYKETHRNVLSFAINTGPLLLHDHDFYNIATLFYISPLFKAMKSNFCGWKDAGRNNSYSFSAYHMLITGENYIYIYSSEVSSERDPSLL